MINNIKTFGKFLDQPLLIAKLDKKMPLILGGAATGYYLKKGYDTFVKNKDDKKDIEEKKKDYLKKGMVLAFAVTSALLAPKIASKITKRTPLENIDKVKEKNNKLIDEFLSKNPCGEKEKNILLKAKEKVLNLSEIKELISKLSKDKKGQEFIDKLIPEPENIKAKDIFSEIGYLSVYGAVPVAGGVLGGVAADVAFKDDYKKNLPDKVDEGLYQYLANIFMCNIGAGAALGLLEKMKITSKSARALGMTAGIILTGVVGGSKIANFVSEKVINPLIFKNKKEDKRERKPELLDLGLHTDDIATVSLLSGLKWIEPALPVLYSVSGYKAGTGYRN